MVAITHIQRKQIDIQAWDKAVDGSDMPLVYALSWYLDAVTEGQWDALVVNDYQSVMPLPWNKKLLIPQIYQPPFTQQLGVFSQKSSSVDINEFLKAIPQKFKRISYPFPGRAKPLKAESLKERTNLLLDLNKPYSELQSGYSKSLKKLLRQVSGELRIRRIKETESLIQFYRLHMGKSTGLSDWSYNRTAVLFGEMTARKVAKIYQVEDKTGEVLACGLFAHSYGRLIYLIGASSPKGRDLKAMHTLLDYVIQKNAHSKLLFDFEGSDIPGVRIFFESFGPVRELYYVYKSDRLSTPMKWLWNLGRAIKH